MKAMLFLHTIALLTTILASGCAAPSTTPASPGAATDRPDQATPDRFDHKPKLDTVAWQTASFGLPEPAVKETDREWPGDEMGLIGPIIAMGGKGANTYLLVFDPAGVLVGGITQKEARQNPQALEALIRKAHDRGEVQNYHAMQYMNALEFQALLTAREQRRAP